VELTERLEEARNSARWELRSRAAAAALHERGEGGKRCSEAGALDPTFIGPRGEGEGAAEAVGAGSSCGRH
jgi:hypothetical protein